MPTRILRSETGCQGPLGRSAELTPDSPRIFWLGASAARTNVAPAATAKEARVVLRRTERREGVFIGRISVTAASAKEARCGIRGMGAPPMVRVLTHSGGTPPEAAIAQ